MDFELDDEQKLLRDTTRELLARSYDDETRTTVKASARGWSEVVWRRLAETGLLGLGFADEDGGSGAGPVEVGVMMTELGRRLAPEPVLDAVLVPGSLIAEVGTEAQRRKYLPLVTGGGMLTAFAHAEPGLRWPAVDVGTSAVQQGDSWLLTGTKNPVPHGDCADAVVVSAALSGGGLGLFLVSADAPGLTRHPYHTHDGLRAAQIALDGVVAEPLGDAADAWDTTAAIRAAHVRAQAALCAEAVGVMEETLRLTVEYLRTRKQFGVPLAAFQTLTQRAADMYVSLELARSMSLYATLSLAEGVADPIVASRAKLRVGRSARHIGQEAIQMHGGIGMTAEYAVGQYVSRLTAIEHTLGGTDDHLRVLAADVAEHGMVKLTDQ